MTHIGVCVSSGTTSLGVTAPNNDVQHMLGKRLAPSAAKKCTRCSVLMQPDSERRRCNLCREKEKKRYFQKKREDGFVHVQTKKSFLEEIKNKKVGDLTKVKFQGEASQWFGTWTPPVTKEDISVCTPSEKVKQEEAVDELDVAEAVEEMTIKLETLQVKTESSTVEQDLWTKDRDGNLVKVLLASRSGELVLINEPNTNHNGKDQHRTPTTHSLSHPLNDTPLEPWRNTVIQDRMSSEVIECIESASGFVWSKGRTRQYNTSLKYSCFCFQDQARHRETPADNTDPPNTKKNTKINYSKIHDCDSMMELSYDQARHSLTIKYRHRTHETPKTAGLMTKMTKDSKRIIREEFENNPMVTTERMFDILKAQLPANGLPHHCQVRDMITKLLGKYVKQDDDEFRSAMMVLSGYQDHVVPVDLSTVDEYNHVKSLGFIIKRHMNLISRSTKFFVDGTFNVTSKKVELHGVLGEIDGVGIPIAYIFTNGYRAVHLEKIIDSMSKCEKLNTSANWMTDKDERNITAIKLKLSKDPHICQWHFVEAVETRATKSDFTSWQEKLVKALKDNKIPPHLLTAIDLKAGSRTSALNKMEAGVLKQKLYTLMSENIQLLSSNIFGMTKEKAHQTIELWILEFCVEKLDNHIGLFWYLYCQWLGDVIERVFHVVEFVHLNTNNQIEGHWSRVKHKHLLYRLHSRLDVIVFMVLKSVLPFFSEKADWLEEKKAVTLNDFNNVGPNWRFKLNSTIKDFMNMTEKEKSTKDKGRVFLTSVASVQCSCPFLKHNNFGLCHHLVDAMVQRAGLRIDLNFFKFIKEVQRSDVAPLLRHPLLQSCGDAITKDQIFTEVLTKTRYSEDENVAVEISSPGNVRSTDMSLEDIIEKELVSAELEDNLSKVLSLLSRARAEATADLRAARLEAADAGGNEEAVMKALDMLQSIPKFSGTNEKTTLVRLKYFVDQMTVSGNQVNVCTWQAPVGSGVSSEFHLSVQKTILFMMRKGIFGNP